MMYWLTLLFIKVKGIFLKIWDFIRWWPKRLLRLGRHLWVGIIPGQYNWWPERYRPAAWFRIRFWWLELLLYMVELAGLMELYEILMDFIKFPSRPLSKDEITWAKSIFGNTLDYNRIRLDHFAIIGPAWFKIAYVSGFHINCWKRISPAILMHELCHVWQYQQVGLVYIPRALWAQFTSEGYDYGGPQRIWESLQSGGFLDEFNYEQQAEIVADYFRLLQGHRPEYHYGINAQPAMYAGLLRDMGAGNT